MAAKGADAVLSTLVGRNSIAFHEADAELTGPTKRAPIASLTTTEAKLALMRPEARQGNLAVAPYFGTLVNTVNDAFVAKFRGKYGSGGPGVYSEVTYSLVHFYANALELAGSEDTDAILGALSGAAFKAPGGDVHIDTETNPFSIRPLIGKANMAGQCDIVWQSPNVIRADPYLIAYDRSVSKLMDLPATALPMRKTVCCAAGARSECLSSTRMTKIGKCWLTSSVVSAARQKACGRHPPNF